LTSPSAFPRVARAKLAQVKRKWRLHRRTGRLHLLHLWLASCSATDQVNRKADDEMAQREIGKFIYLFTRGVSSDFSDEVVISAHGGYRAGDLPFTVEGPTLKFYCVEDAPANESGLICYPHMVKESRAPGDSCKNYRSQKFQGRHGTADGKTVQSYDGIQKEIENSGGRIREHNEMIAAASGEELRAAGLTDNPVSAFDVATIRNRKGHGELRLQYVVDELLKVHRYKVVHCSFCRVRE
jgi:Putative adhesin Stv domain